MQALSGSGSGGVEDDPVAGVALYVERGARRRRPDAEITCTRECERLRAAAGGGGVEAEVGIGITLEREGRGADIQRAGPERVPARACGAEVVRGEVVGDGAARQERARERCGAVAVYIEYRRRGKCRGRR